MTLLDVDALGTLTAPVIVTAFDGWVNAGSAGTTAAEHLAGDSPVVGRVDPDLLFDYRAVRPTADFVDGVLTEVAYPELTLRHRSLGGRDVLILSGTEPNWNWRSLGRDLSQHAVRLGVVEYVSLGGIPWATAHTRMTSVILTASQPEDLPPDPHRPAGTLRVPASATSALEKAVADQGIPCHGFWARVPQYVGATYLPAAVALLERVSTQLGVSVPYGSIVEDAAEQRTRLDEITAARPEVRALVEQLEALSDEEETSGEELAAEIERFLQGQPGADGMPGEL